MSFREKSAWITLVTVLVVFTAYFGALLTGRVEGFHSLYLLLISVIGLVAMQAGLHVIAVLTTPRDGRAPKDEREVAIQWRSQSIGYYVLTVFALALFVPVHSGHTALDMANFALFAVAIATVCVAVAQIIMFRRGA